MRPKGFEGYRKIWKELKRIAEEKQVEVILREAPATVPAEQAKDLFIVDTLFR